VIGWKLEPKEEDYVPAVAGALRQLNAADSERARSGRRLDESTWCHQLNRGQNRALGERTCLARKKPTLELIHLLSLSDYFDIFRYFITLVKC